MKALLLAAGRSRRAKPIEDKNFLKFCGKTLIEFQIESLKQAGFTDILIAAGEHNMERLQGVASQHGATVIQQENLDDGMAGALLATKPHLNDEELFVVSSNDVVAASAYEAVLKATESGADAYLLAYKVDEYFPGGYLQITDGRITDIVEKPGAGNEPSDMINIVLHWFRDPKTLFAELEKTTSDKDDRYEVALDTLMNSQRFEPVPYDGMWQPVKFPWHVLDLMPFFFENMEAKIDPSSEISESAILKGKVCIEAGVKIFDNAVVQGPAYIGKNSVIANNALVRGSVIGDDCVVGYSCEIARSFIGDDCWFHSNYVGDTVMGNNNSFGAGAVCANLRLDEKNIGDSNRNKLGPILGDNIRVGVNTSLMPGVKIGSNSMITSGLVVAQDIEPGKYVHGKTELAIKDNRATLDDSAREEMKKKLG
jgi:UDP-N-acetylglucosamine diphosphorylase / glucose-1-phosphate thymidylyltransferase / UDP-N-acetylgalactosamine diphosphorylase / glucosamine-1-phosphate N-acetyltransferase / galactosamine-1-phosphate N-acetyltransferase